LTPEAKGKLDFSAKVNESLNLNPLSANTTIKDAKHKNIQRLVIRKSPFELLSPKNAKAIIDELSD
jgi:hypothetical protein